MKKLIYIALLLLFGNSLLGQNTLSNAIYSLKNNELDKAKQLIDAAAVDTLFLDKAATWYYRGYIYKDLFKRDESDNKESPLRAAAVEYFTKSLKIEPEGTYAESSKKSLKFLAQGSNFASDSTKSDTNRFKIGNTIVILISEGEMNINSDSSKSKRNKKQRWNHYAGIDIGINGWLSAKNSFDLPEDAQFMDLDYGKSISLSINFFEQYIPIVHEKFGISTGLGFEFNKYTLSRDYTIIAARDSTYGFQDTTISLQKNLFKSEVLNWPVMLETNIGKDAKHSFHLAVGGMLSYRLGAKTKQIFIQEGKEYKVKNRTNFNTNPFLFNLVARIGYGDFTLFASYSLTPLFEKNKGPELYPFNIGVSLFSF